MTASEFFNCTAAASAGVEWSVNQTSPSSWTARLTLPFSYIATALGADPTYGTGEERGEWRANFYRIEVANNTILPNYTEPWWFPSQPGTGYYAIQPTYVWPVAFHRPAYFLGLLTPKSDGTY